MKAPNFDKRTVVCEIPGKGFQKRTAVYDQSGSHLVCYRVGGLPYAKSLDASQRWHRASAIAESYAGYYGTKARPTDFSGQAAECPQPGRRPRGAKEACHELNVWVPAGEAPARGWPVFFYIHGGFLQWGTANGETPAALYAETPLRAVIVAPSYRLNVFGFLTCTETQGDSPQQSVANLGFWDQRLALEWTARWIGDYGGDAGNITVGGLSAGAYSTFHQLAHEALCLPPSRQLIRRAVLWSNGCGLPPKTVAETRTHFDALCDQVGVSKSLSAAEKLQQLRALPAEALVRAVEALPENAFRAVAESSADAFIHPLLFHALRSGKLGRELARRNVRLLLGEVRDEFNSYRLNSPPSDYAGLVDRLAVEYPVAAARRIARVYAGPNEQLPAGVQSWQDVFGHAYADMQVHVSQRGLIDSIAPHMPADSLLRYRITWRPRCVDAIMPAAMRVAHGSDMSIWWFGNGWDGGLREEEKQAVREFADPLAYFLWGEEAGRRWGTLRVEEQRTLTEDGGHVEIRRDERWEEATRVFGEVLGEGKSKL